MYHNNDRESIKNFLVLFLRNIFHHENVKSCHTYIYC